MGDSRIAIPIILGIVVLGVAGLYQYTNAENHTDFVCTANSQNGHVNCSNPPTIGDSGLFILDSENSCPIDVTFTLENRFVVKFGDHPDCKFNDGFTLALTLDN